MSLSKAKVRCSLLIILLSISAFYNGVDGARYLKEQAEDKNQEPKNAINNNLQVSDTEGNGFFATIHREVPSGPDPLHNK